VPHSIESDREVDSGLAVLVLLACFHGLPADPDHLSHQRGATELFSSTDIVISAKSLGLKAG
jgi:subfamily B ATP-binding cassette protein HlyB/CyaB